MNIQNLEPGKYSRLSSLRGQAVNAYERLAGTNDYMRNGRYLKVIHVCTVTLSAAATGYVNAFAHVKQIGLALSSVLAVVVTGFVEAFFFTLRHGLTTTYKSGAQRLYAQFWYRVLMATMVLNVVLLGLRLFNAEPPAWLLFYNHYSIAIHFCAALIGVAMVRDSDAVVRNRILELRAETGRQDLITARKSAAIGSSLALVAAKIRGFFDAASLSLRILFNRSGFARDYMKQINDVAREQYAYLDALPSSPPSSLPAQRRVGFGAEDEAPKAPARWI
jgi:hypothetical protein